MFRILPPNVPMPIRAVNYRLAVKTIFPPDHRHLRCKKKVTKKRHDPNFSNKSNLSRLAASCPNIVRTCPTLLTFQAPPQPQPQHRLQPQGWHCFVNNHNLFCHLLSLKFPEVSINLYENSEDLKV